MGALSAAPKQSRYCGQGTHKGCPYGSFCTQLLRTRTGRGGAEEGGHGLFEGEVLVFVLALWATCFLDLIDD